MPSNPIVHVQDDFFEDGDATRKSILSANFSDVTSPVDNVTYPDICLDVPEQVRNELISKISKIMNLKVIPKFLFARAMIKGRPVPHKVHSDFNMAAYSAHVYLSPKWPEGSGTSFYRHQTEGEKGNYQTDWSQISHNEMDKWHKYARVPAKFNKLLIHRSEFWHMAEPQDAWGDNHKNGRLVLTMFFDTGEL